MILDSARLPDRLAAAIAPVDPDRPRTAEVLDESDDSEEQR
ncbi:hypothetical protein [Streptomyces sp. ISL-94]|nr:hypothetical protein [Streptomyces sp. ISL-94]